METAKRSGRITDIHLLTVKKQAPCESLSGKIPEKTKRGRSEKNGAPLLCYGSSGRLWR